MKIGVIGAGVVGVSTAYALASAGHEVHVFDEGETVATGASQANGAQLSYSYVDPFAGPATLRKLPAYLCGLDPAIRFGISLNPSYLSWGLKFLGECRSSRAHTNMLARAALASKSRVALETFMQGCENGALRSTGEGKIVLAGTKDDLQQMERGAKQKEALGIHVSALSKEDCLAKEPALRDWRGEWAGGIYAPADQALDPVQYCEALKAACEQKFGVQFHFGERLRGIQISADHISGISTEGGQHGFDRVVLCLGSKVNEILRPLGLSVPIYPIQGYSLTLPFGSIVPQASLTDLKNKVVFANLGDKLRIAGFMDANQNPKRARARSGQILEIARKMWPSVATYDADPNFWTQYRPMTPSGVPIIGESKIRGLYLNVGHGALGYTFAAGSGVEIAEKIGPLTGKCGPQVKRKKHA